MADHMQRALPCRCGRTPLDIEVDDPAKRYAGGFLLVQLTCEWCDDVEGPAKVTLAEAVDGWNRLHMLPEGVADGAKDPWSIFGPFKQDVGPDLYGIKAHILQPCLDSNDSGTEPVTGPGPDGRYGSLPKGLAEHIVTCHNALDGLNPEALGEFVAAVEEFSEESEQHWRECRDKVRAALAKLKGEG